MSIGLGSRLSDGSHYVTLRIFVFLITHRQYNKV